MIMKYGEAYKINSYEALFNTTYLVPNQNVSNDNNPTH